MVALSLVRNFTVRGTSLCHDKASIMTKHFQAIGEWQVYVKRVTRGCSQLSISMNKSLGEKKEFFSFSNFLKCFHFSHLVIKYLVKWCSSSEEKRMCEYGEETFVHVWKGQYFSQQHCTQHLLLKRRSHKWELKALCLIKRALHSYTYVSTFLLLPLVCLNVPYE